MKQLLASALLLCVLFLPVGAQSTAVSQISGIVQDAELARVTEVSREDKIGDEVPEDEVIETKVERRRSSAFKDKETTDSP